MVDNPASRSVRRDLDLCSLKVSEQDQIPRVDITTTSPGAIVAKIVYNTVDGCLYYSHLLPGSGYVWVKLVSGAPISSERGFGVFRQSTPITAFDVLTNTGDPWTAGTVYSTAMSAVRTAFTTLSSPSTITIDKDGSYSITWTASAVWDSIGGPIPAFATYEFGVGVNGAFPTEAMVASVNRFGIGGPPLELTGTTQLDLVDGDILTFYHRRTAGGNPFSRIHIDAQELRITRESP